MTNTEAAQLLAAAHTVRGISLDNWKLPYPSLAALLFAREQSSGSAPFLIYYNEAQHRTEYSYRHFIRCVRDTAALLYHLGIRRGGRIAIAAHNHPDTTIQYFAAWSMGVCIVPLNMSEDNNRLRYILQNSGATVLLCREDYITRLPECMPLTGLHVVPVYNEPDTPGGFHELLNNTAPKGWTTEEPSAYDEALIVYTSGTTGNPKAVVLTQGNILADAEAIMTWFDITPEQRMMCVLPVHHVNGTIVTHATPMLAGASVVLHRKFRTDVFFESCRREGVKIVSVVPTLLAFLIEAEKKRREQTAQYTPLDTGSLQTVICGAGPLTCELARQFEEYCGLRVHHGYGLSETTCYSCFLPVDLSDDEYHHWMMEYGFPSIGLPIHSNEMAIHDDHGNSLPEMERGEIVVRGANVMKEYFNNPEANHSTFAFGWFRSGDEGFFRRDNKGREFFFITGRMKELIIRGGVNLAPLEIDEILAKAPGVQAAICVGFDNDFYGEEVGALVIPTETASEAEILAYCRQHLPLAKTPKVVVFTDTLPVTSTGKYQRNKVKHLFSAWKAVQFGKKSG